MKFTKEELTEALKAKLTANGKKLTMSERTLKSNVERIYRRLEKVNDETLELDAAVEDYLPDFEEIEGNMRKDNADFVKEWEKQHPKPKDEPKPKDDEPNDKLDALLKEIGELKKEREAEKAAKVVSDKREALKAALKGKDVKNDDWINDQLDLIAINADTDIDNLTTRLVSSYNKFSANTPKSVTPGGAGGAPENNEHQFDDIVEALAE